MPTGVFEKMYKHVLTDAGLKQFDIDYAESLKADGSQFVYLTYIDFFIILLE